MPPTRRIAGRFADPGGAGVLDAEGRRPRGRGSWPRRWSGPRPTGAGRSTSRYLQVLGRRPDPAGRTYWVGRLATDGGEQALMASLLATESFRTAATH